MTSNRFFYVIALTALLATLFATCKKEVAVKEVSLNKETLMLSVGDKETLTVTILPENAANKAVTFESSDPAVAAILSSGLVTALSQGTAIVKAKTNDGNKIAECIVIVSSMKLTTAAAKNITDKTATLGGTIIKVGEPEYFERGIVYSRWTNPTTANTKRIIAGTGTGNFDIDVSGLSSFTTYYVRAYAINSDVAVYGTAYGNEVSFTTPFVPGPGEGDIIFVQGETFTREGYKITLSDFYIGKYEVTEKQWVDVMGSNPSYNKKGDNYPVENVSWNSIVGTSGASMVINGITYYANGFIYKLNQKTGRKYRLPTEAEWEYAARGGNKSNNYTCSGSNNIGDVAWYYSNSSDGKKEVGTKAPNELGIYDMSGNVWEWCSDWYGSYEKKDQTNPTGPTTGSGRVLRGGSWNSNAEYCRVSIRGNSSPNSSNYILGFRLVLSL